MSLMDFVDEYGLLVVIVGIIASVICGAIKIPLAKKIKSSGLTEKAASDRLRAICTVIISVISVISIVMIRCIPVHSLSPLGTRELYTEILSSIMFSKIVYKLYEGIDKVSLKKWIHALIEKIINKAETLPAEEKDSVKDWVAITQKALTDILKMPMTDSQKEALEKALQEKQEETEDEKEE